MRPFFSAAAILLVSAAGALAADPEAVLLWPDGAPDAKADAGEPSIRLAGGERVVSNVHAPVIYPYIASEDTATGCGVVVCPGGGHRELWSDHEGHNLAKWLQERGVSAFVLLYRLAEEPDSPYTVDDHSLADLRRSLRLIRSRSDAWRVDPKRLGAAGFSAGGEVVALAGMARSPGDADAEDAVDRQSGDPNFQGLIYPGRSRRYTVSGESPPLFIACGFRDRPDISRGMAELYLKYKEARVPAELHIYATAGHGFGVRSRNGGAVAAWPERMLDWLRDTRMIAAAE